jgi:F-type H+-transporting ATPase subunit b
MPESTAHTEIPSGHRTFPPFEKEFFASQLVWLGVTFVLLYVLMAKVALPRIGSILDSRNKRITDDLMAAKQLKEQSDVANAAYGKALNDARGCAQVVASTAREQQAAAAAAVRSQVEAQLKRKLGEAEKAISAARTAAMANVRSIAADAASAIIEQLVGRVPTKRDVTAAVADALRK